MAETLLTNVACELKRKLRVALVITVLSVVPAIASAQEHAPPARQGEAHAAEAAGQHAPEDGEHAESLGQMLLGMGWAVANFVIFLGVIYYFGNKPFSDYLANRSSTIRKDLVEAAALKSTATSQLQQIEQKLQALPGEIAALRTRGADEIRNEEQRIAAAASAERDRLLEQTRREIDLQVRLAKKEILEHAADLSVQLATDRIRKEITPADQDRLVDRYLQQVKEQ
jgi:F-type H+-transporting ATPase subunit b